MIIKLNKFGTILTSRPDGKEAYLAAKANSLPKNDGDKIEIDFLGVKVLTPAWADEFITPIVAEYGSRVKLMNTDNSSVEATLRFLETIK